MPRPLCTDVHALFLSFDATFFQGHLQSHGVAVSWSPRMTLCAGVCSLDAGGFCSIRLSKPLLSLRQRADLVNTLLHEMIHAFLFLTTGHQDRDGHGAAFQSHMRRINEQGGCAITVFHTFHDEVDHYRRHIWRCTGACRSRPPHFGFVKRAMNRAPSPRDPWWARHAASCTGTFEKIAEPEPAQRNAGKKRARGAALLPAGQATLTGMLGSAAASSAAHADHPSPGLQRAEPSKRPSQEHANVIDLCDLPSAAPARPPSTEHVVNLISDDDSSASCCSTGCLDKGSIASPPTCCAGSPCSPQPAVHAPGSASYQFWTSKFRLHEQRN